MKWVLVIFPCPTSLIGSKPYLMKQEILIHFLNHCYGLVPRNCYYSLTCLMEVKYQKFLYGNRHRVTICGTLSWQSRMCNICRFYNHHHWIGWLEIVVSHINWWAFGLCLTWCYYDHHYPELEVWVATSNEKLSWSIMLSRR